MTWTPQFAAISDSGDLGYTYGLWQAKGRGLDGSERSATGKYVTIWKRAADGGWQVVFDGGNSLAP